MSEHGERRKCICDSVSYLHGLREKDLALNNMGTSVLYCSLESAAGLGGEKLRCQITTELSCLVKITYITSMLLPNLCQEQSGFNRPKNPSQHFLNFTSSKLFWQ